MIPVPVKQQSNTPYPLSVEDTDIPFIEDESRQTNSKKFICYNTFNTYNKYEPKKYYIYFLFGTRIK